MDARIVDGRKIARVTDDGKLKVLVHGRDGDNLVPVKVSEDGYLMLATDVTVEGVTVDLGTVDLNQGAPGQNPWPVTLSGTSFEDQIFYQKLAVGKFPIYGYGHEYVDIDTGYSAGSEGWQSKQSDYLELGVTAGASTTTQRSYVTRKTFDLSNVDYVLVSVKVLENSHTSGTNQGFHLVVSKEKEGAFDEAIAHIHFPGEADGVYRDVLLDVKSLSGMFYVRTHVRSSSLNRPYSCHIREISLLKMGGMVSSGLLANRPLASAVPPGFAYYSWDAPEGQEMAYSDGTNWRVKS